MAKSGVMWQKVANMGNMAKMLRMSESEGVKVWECVSVTV